MRWRHKPTQKCVQRNPCFSLQKVGGGGGYLAAKNSSIPAENGSYPTDFDKNTNKNVCFCDFDNTTKISEKEIDFSRITPVKTVGGKNVINSHSEKVNCSHLRTCANPSTGNVQKVKVLKYNKKTLAAILVCVWLFVIATYCAIFMLLTNASKESGIGIVPMAQTNTSNAPTISQSGSNRAYTISTLDEFEYIAGLSAETASVADYNTYYAEDVICTITCDDLISVSNNKYMGTENRPFRGKCIFNITNGDLDGPVFGWLNGATIVGCETAFYSDASSLSFQNRPDTPYWGALANVAIDTAFSNINVCESDWDMGTPVSDLSDITRAITNSTMSERVMYVGGIVGACYGITTFENCNISGSHISSKCYAGAYAGACYGNTTISNDQSDLSTVEITALCSSINSGEAGFGLIGYVGVDAGVDAPTYQTSNYTSISFSASLDCDISTMAELTALGFDCHGITIVQSQDFTLYSGVGRVGTKATPFRGTYNGNAKTINLYSNSSSSSSVPCSAPFNYIRDAKITDLNINCVSTMERTTFAGMITNVAIDSTISFVKVEGVGSNGDFIGACIGYAKGCTIDNVNLSTYYTSNSSYSYSGVVGYGAGSNTITNINRASSLTNIGFQEGSTTNTLANGKITIDLNGGDPDLEQSLVLTKSGTSCALPSALTRKGYYISGYTAITNVSSISGFICNYASASTASLVKASWAVGYAITYKDMGGGAYSGSNLSSLPSNYPNPTTTSTLTLVNGVKAGYKFLGWYLNDSTCSGESITQLAGNSYAEIVLYAKWELDTSRITFNFAYSGVNPNGDSVILYIYKDNVLQNQVALLGASQLVLEQSKGGSYTILICTPYIWTVTRTSGLGTLSGNKLSYVVPQGNATVNLTFGGSGWSSNSVVI